MLRNYNLLVYLYPNTRCFYGPYLGKDKRYRVVIYDGVNRQTRQYAKLKMEIKLERRIEEPETVDHFNGNTRDDRYDNLQVLFRKEHIKKDVLRRPHLKLSCPLCNKTFEPSRNQISNVNNRKSSGPFCSRVCAAKYNRDVQLGRRKRENKRIEYKLGKL